MNIAIVGATGFIGRNLINRLLKETDHTIVALSPGAESIDINNKRLKKHSVDVFDTKNLSKYIKNCDVAYYLIHMMTQVKMDFSEAESKAAMSFCEAASTSDVKRVIYLGGLGSDSDNLSKHLKSRHKTGEILRKKLTQVIEFRASMIIGRGGISYDIFTSLIDKLPILLLPKWTNTLTQPIGLDDCLKYLVSALNLKITKHEIVEIGGPETLSYRDLMKRYADWKNKKVFFVEISLIPANVAGWWFNLFTPKVNARVGRIMVDSLSNQMTVTNSKSKKLFPKIHPKSLEEVFV